MVQVTIYGGPGCMKCKLTKNAFTDEGVIPEYIEDPDVALALAEKYDLGRSLPVVHVVTPSGEQFWGDFRRDRIRAVVQERRDLATAV